MTIQTKYHGLSHHSATQIIRHSQTSKTRSRRWKSVHLVVNYSTTNSNATTAVAAGTFEARQNYSTTFNGSSTTRRWALYRVNSAANTGHVTGKKRHAQYTKCGKTASRCCSGNSCCRQALQATAVQDSHVSTPNSGQATANASTETNATTHYSGNYQR